MKKVKPPACYVILPDGAELHGEFQCWEKSASGALMAKVKLICGDIMHVEPHRIKFKEDKPE